MVKQITIVTTNVVTTKSLDTNSNLVTTNNFDTNSNASYYKHLRYEQQSSYYKQCLLASTENSTPYKAVKSHIR